MIPILFVLFSFLDVQRPVIAVDGVEKQFVVSELVEQSLTGCAENGQGGQRAVGSQLELPLRYDNPLPLGAGVDERNNVKRITSAEGYCDGTASSSMRVVPVDPPNPNPDPNPPTPPIASTPEPSTFAILGITAAMLLFLLFGRQYGRRFSRY